MVRGLNKPGDFIEHCEAYLFKLVNVGAPPSQELGVEALPSLLNNYEKALFFDYLYLKMKERAQAGGGGFFPVQVFLVMISSLIYQELKNEANPQSVSAFEAAASRAANKVWKMRTWNETGRPPDDVNLLNEVCTAIAESHASHLPQVLAMLEGLGAVRKPREAAPEPPGAPESPEADIEEDENV